MNMERATEVLENGDWWKWLSQEIPTLTSLEFHDALDFAIAALRARQEREKGCEFCRRENPSECRLGAQASMYLIVGGGSVRHAILFRPEDRDQSDSLIVRFCPMCGRRLEGEK